MITKRFRQPLIIAVLIIAFISLNITTNQSTKAAGTWTYLHTSGKNILDANGNIVHISGVNWFGAETPDYAPDGLWSINYKTMLNQIKANGYNTLRLPYSTDFLDFKDTGGGYTPNLSTYANPELAGLKGVPLLDAIISYAGSIGLRVFLDRHRAFASYQSALWYEPGSTKYTEQRWIDDWKWLAAHYANNPTVVGADLHNEPHSVQGDPTKSACWGCGDTLRDWRLAAQRAGNAILSVNPNWLIIVEGNDVNVNTGSTTWWGGELSNAGTMPVTLSLPGHVVYSPHEYPASLFAQTWFSDPSYPNNLPGVWDSHWGYLAKQDIAPVLIGEWGSKLATTSDQQWFNSLASYIKTNQLNWTFWSWNPNSGDTGGILADDWTTIIAAKQSVLSTIQYPFIGDPGTTGPTNTPAPATKTNTPGVPTNTPIPPTKTNTPSVPTNTPVPPTKTNTPSVPTNTSVAPTATKTNTPVAPTATANPADPCASPTVITGGGTFAVGTTAKCFKYVNTTFTRGGMFSVMKDASATSDTLKWYGGLDQNATACANQSSTISGNGGQLNNFTIAKDANGQMFLTITGAAANNVTISITNWQNGNGCSVVPTVHP